MPRNAEFENGHTPKCVDCGKPNTDSHQHISFSPEETDRMKAWINAVQLGHMGAEIERTRTVDLNNKADLLDHLNSNNGHIMEGFGQWRNSHGEDHIPGVRPAGDEDFELTHKELMAIHDHEHAKYGDEEPHTTLDTSHFHH